MHNRPDYDAGDLVVCVDADPAGDHFANFALARLVRGKVYTVKAVKRAPNRQWSCRLSEVSSLPCVHGFLAARFRRIDPKPPEFWTGSVDADTRERVPA